MQPPSISVDDVEYLTSQLDMKNQEISSQSQQIKSTEAKLLELMRKHEDEKNEMVNIYNKKISEIEQVMEQFTLE